MPQNTAQDSDRLTQRQRAHERAPRSSGFSLGSILGVKIRVDWSLLIIFALVVFNLGAGFFPRLHPDWAGLPAWGLAVAAATLFFASVLVHELSHAAVARAYGIEVDGITLFLFGGVTHMGGEPPSPKAEFLVAGAGPLTSAIIGIVAIWVGQALAGDALPSSLGDGQEAMMAALADLSPVASLLLWLGPINLLLAVFNVVPGFPLDGGRVLRAILWRLTGDFTKSTRWASGAGQGFAWFLMAIGVMNLLSGAPVQGVWMLLIGWFLNNAARMSYERLLTHQALSGVPVRRLMRTEIRRVPPDLRLNELVSNHLMATDQQSFPVEDEGRLLGLVCLEDVRSIPQAEWPTTAVSGVMTPTEELHALPPEAAAEQALDKLAEGDVGQIPILEHEHLLGLLRRQDLMKWLSLHAPSRA
jgi:Zn-dependent protease/CBS domain-containing protein